MSCITANLNTHIKEATFDALDKYHKKISSVDSLFPGIVQYKEIYDPNDKDQPFSEVFKTTYGSNINTDLNNIRDESNNLFIQEDTDNVYANCVLQSGNKWFSTNPDYTKCTSENYVKFLLPKKQLIEKNNAIYTNFSSSDKTKSSISLYASNVNRAYCENRWYDWIVTPNFYLGNTYFKDIGKYTKMDVNRCYKPCEGDYMPYITEKNEYMCIPKKYYGNGIFNNKYMFCALGLINLIGNYAGTIGNTVNRNNDYNFMLYKLILNYNLLNNVNDVFEERTNLKNEALDYPNRYTEFYNIYKEYENSINKNILKNFINSSNQSYYYSPNFTYKSPLFNENDSEMYTLKGLDGNNLLTPPILIHTWVLANMFKPYKTENEINDLLKSATTPENLTHDFLTESKLLYDLLFVRLPEQDQTLKGYKAARLKNIFFKAVNICYDGATNFSKNIISETINALNNSNLINYIITENLYQYTTPTLALIPNHIGFKRISDLRDVLSQTKLEEFKPFKYYDDKDINDINSKIFFRKAQDTTIISLQNYLFACEELEQKTCKAGEIYDKSINGCKKILPKIPGLGLENSDTFDDGLQIPKLKAIFAQFLKIIIAIIIIFIIYFLFNIWHETILSVFNYIYLIILNTYYYLLDWYNGGETAKHKEDLLNRLKSNLEKNKTRIEKYLAEKSKNKE
jgi:hypothetical protein